MKSNVSASSWLTRVHMLRIHRIYLPLGGWQWTKVANSARIYIKNSEWYESLLPIELRISSYHIQFHSVCAFHIHSEASIRALISFIAVRKEKELYVVELSSVHLFGLSWYLPKYKLFRFHAITAKTLWKPSRAKGHYQIILLRLILLFALFLVAFVQKLSHRCVAHAFQLRTLNHGQIITWIDIDIHSDRYH